MKLSDDPETFLQRYAFVLSDDRKRLDIDWVLDQLASYYWSKDEPKERLRQAIENAHPYGLYAPDGAPAGFLSVLSDKVYNARLSHFFITPKHRGRGLARWVMSTLLFESQFQHVQSWQLATDDASAFYERFGFRVFESDGKFMTRKR